MNFLLTWFKKLFRTPTSELRKYKEFDMFHSGQWFQIFNACGQYKDRTNDLSDEEQLYHLIHQEMLTKRTDIEIEKFPNHYTFLKEWYAKLAQ